jgi:AcrR family transcriptional regulator
VQGRAVRRLARDARREQLLAAAMPVLARHGFADFSLEAIAERAGVTRNLLYHYFPRGRPDIVLAVVERAGRQLSHEALDEPRPLSDQWAASIARIMEHALAPTHAWRIHRMARVTLDPEVASVVARFVDVVTSSIALQHLDTRDPPPLVRLALEGFLSYVETVLERARVEGLSRDSVARLMAQTLSAVIDAALRAS